jgi:NADH-ubiquinone oxidoreductase chain 2
LEIVEDKAHFPTLSPHPNLAVQSKGSGGSGEVSLKDINYLIELKGQLYKNPILSISLAICLFSMAGIPPLIGFFSKQFVLFSSIENGNNFLSIIAILVSVISASYYLKLIKITFFSNVQDSDTFPSPAKASPSEGSLAPQPYGLVEGEAAFLFGAPSLDQGNDYLKDREIIISNGYLSNIHSYIIAILTFLILFFFLDPSILLNGTQLISLTIFNL